MRIMAKVGLVLALALTSLGVTVGPAAAASGTAIDTLNVRATPSTSAKVVGTIAKGRRVNFTCYKMGTAVRGPYGTSSYWLSVDGNQGKWVSEAWVYTGTNKITVPLCRPAVTPPGGSLSARVDAFVRQWNGKYADFDRMYGAQCFDLFNFYNRDVVRAARAGGMYAYQIWDTYDRAKYTRVSAASTPHKGDVAVWAGNFPPSRGAGHVAIVLRTSGSSFEALTQNPGATKKQWFSKSYLRGFLRPKA